MPLRFLIDLPVSGGEEIVVSPERARYLTKVMRKKTGDLVACFDGCGTAFTTAITNVSTKQCTLAVTARDAKAPAPANRLHLGIGLLKGPAMDRAMQQATELGVTNITLLDAKRSNVHLRESRATNKFGHWQKVIAAACEQSGRLYLPTLAGPTSLSQLLDEAVERPLVLDANGAPLPSKLEAMDRLLLIGPEGGWDDSERALFGARAIEQFKLGPHILRAETTPAVALALLQQAQGWPD